MQWVKNTKFQKLMLKTIVTSLTLFICSLSLAANGRNVTNQAAGS